MLSSVISVLADGLRFIEQTIETRIRLSYALARQWFGVYITPEASNDGKALNICLHFVLVRIQKLHSDIVTLMLLVRMALGWTCWVSD